MWIKDALCAQGPPGLNEGVHRHTVECGVQAATSEVQKVLGHREGENGSALERFKTTTWNLTWA